MPYCFMVVLSGPINAGHVDETVPRAGEQRLNRFQFRATHNSYERDNGALDRISIDRQLDVYDTTFLEFDLTWNTDYNELYIQCACTDAAGRALPDSYLTEIAASQRASLGVTSVYFNRARIGPCTFYPAVDDSEMPAIWPTLLQNKFIQTWGSSRIYTSAEFRGIDNQK
ncbi:MAG: hypothetical protein GY703_01475 [Gammaproteobacteria bacterium]|nr:hypothetical protein [Gammaproteobacteria bacterium]